MEKTKGKIAEIIPKTAKTRKGDRKKFNLKIEGDDKIYNGWNECPWKVGDEIEFEYNTEEKEYNDQDTGETKKWTFHNIVQKKQGGSGNFDDIVKALTIPKIHVGMEQEVDTKIIECGTYKKVLVKKVTINLSINPMEINAEEIDKVKKLARLALEDEISSISKVDSQASTSSSPEQKKTPPEGYEDSYDSFNSDSKTGQKSLMKSTKKTKSGEKEEEVREYE